MHPCRVSRASITGPSQVRSTSPDVRGKGPSPWRPPPSLTVTHTLDNPDKGDVPQNAQPVPKTAEVSKTKESPRNSHNEEGPMAIRQPRAMRLLGQRRDINQLGTGNEPGRKHALWLTANYPDWLVDHKMRSTLVRQEQSRWATVQLEHSGISSKVCKPHTALTESLPYVGNEGTAPGLMLRVTV